MAGQQIRFCTAPDGVRIAYATSGGGDALPLVRAATWLTHVEHDVDIYRNWLEDLGADRTYLRYDMRGCGLSDRDVTDFSLTARVSDLEAVVDAAGLDRFDLLGISGGGSVAIAYAARHPDRVAHLVLYGAYARGRGMRGPRTRESEEENALLLSLTRVGWGRANPAFRQVFTTLYMPDASPADVAAYDELQRVSASPDTAAAIRAESYHTDVTELATHVTTPTLVLHVRDDASVPMEEGRLLAGLIPGAQLVTLEGRNHILLPEDPAWRDFVAELRAFVSETPAPRPPAQAAQAAMSALSARERDVLKLVSEGLANDEIAERLALSVRTVERHLSNSYAKLGVSGKSARAAAVARFVRRA